MMKRYPLSEWARQRGYRAVQMSIDHLHSVREKIEALMASGRIDEDLQREYPSGFKFPEENSLKGMGSIVLIAVPRPAHLLTFRLGDREVKAVLPPTYVNYRSLFEEVASDFRKNVAAGDYEVRILSAPLKQLAARGGFIRYGKNNIGYLPGFGSYFQLIGLMTGLSSATGEHEVTVCEYEEQLLADCRDCRLCEKACTPGAIHHDRFLLSAEKCYTYHSESEKPLPPAMQPPSGDCLMGCLRCQLACPVNRKLLRYERTQVLFTLEESNEMLKDPSPRSVPLWDSIKAKFSMLGLSGNLSVFARNLRYLR